MHAIHRVRAVTTAILATAVFAGCAGTSTRNDVAQKPVDDSLNRSTNATAQGQVEPQVVRTREVSAPAPTQAAITDSNKVTVSCSEPSATRAGQCFTRVVYPAQYRDDQTQTIVRPAYEKITYTDPVYEDVQEQVLQRESYTREVELPALYDTFYEQTLVTPAGKVWKPGHGKVERVDPNTGEVFCLVDQPAVYNTVEKKQLKRPASKRVDVVPAGYSTVTVHRLVKAPEQVKTQIPAEYGVVDKQVRTGADSCEYVQVLCEDNATSAKISEVQAALTAKGYDTEATGAVNEDLTDSLKEFQSDQDLPETGLMTARTLDALGVALEIDPNAAIVAPNTQDATRPDASSRNMPSQNTSANPQRQ